MTFENFYGGYTVGFYAFGKTNSWTVDFNIPSQTVYASAALSAVEIAPESSSHDVGGGVISTKTGAGYVFCGVLHYAVEVGTEPAYGRAPKLTDNKNVAPSIFDDNVVIVTFLYGAGDGAGDCGYQILGFG